MFTYQLKIIFRRLLRYRLNALINITGLSIGIAVSFIIGLFIYSELSFDTFHSKHQNIERLTMHINKPGYDMHWARVNNDIINRFKSEFDEIRQLVRFQDYYSRNIKVEEQLFSLDHAYSVDKEVFSIFDFNFISGDETALSKPNTVVLTKSIADKFFGDNDPIGKEISILHADGQTEVRYIITGVIQDLPKKTHLPVNLLTSINREEERSGWAYVYLLLDENADAKLLESKIASFINDHGDESLSDISFHLQNISDIHLYSSLAREIVPNGDISYVYLFVIIGFVILIMSVTNFVNLNTAQSIKFMKDAGIRKFLGSSVGDLKKYYFTESLVIVAISAIIAVFIILFSIPFFRELAILEFPGMLLGLFLILTIPLISLAGSYFPAKILPSQKVSDAFSNKLAGFTLHSKWSLKNFLLASQVVLCVVTISIALITNSQFKFIVNKNLGLDKEQVIAITEIPGVVKWKMNKFRNDLNAISGVIGVTTSMEVPSREIRDSGPVYAEGKIGEENKDTSMDIQVVDKSFLKVMGIDLVAGRNFNKFKSNDITPEIDVDIYGYLQSAPREYLINETAMRMIGWEDPNEAIGRMFSWSIGEIELQKGPIIGVVRDFHQETLKNKVDPLVMINEPVWVNNILVKIEGSNTTQTLSAIVDSWKKNYPGLPIKYSFLDDLYNDLYKAEQNQLKLIYIFSGLAILIAFVGMFGVISYSLRSREKELAVRKVHGASIKSLGILLSKDFLIIALPILPFAYWLTYTGMEKWLQNFVYRIDPTVWHFLIGPVFILLVIAINVLIQLIKASSTNPAIILKSE
ncbi:ABC transporter permease [Mangrovivirga sp. M17]|uniref:ABC transporter permease n=1 Tax=Mangrovivirga halotolerans TaxID=2993936 RepID=A0ABT3RME0_9BACT|nr:ABC transporter permease [Mangrovivirga halotolerans]MCX2742979.1 ABC transporter permease [Mangrovivirga halotolerans]